MKRGTLIIIGGAVVVAIIAVVLFMIGGNKTQAPPAVSLEWWGVFDDESSYAGVISAYKQLHPYVTITYKKFRMEEYENSLIQAWARGAGPDIFALPNSWIGKFQANEFLTPMPASTRMAWYQISRPLGIKQELTISYKAAPSITLNEVRNRFVSVVPQDVILQSKIWGLPQSMDTLTLFYNKDLLNYALITQPPSTWNEFIDIVPKLTILDSTGKIVQSGAALGTGNNIPRVFDIVSALMMQNGATMVDAKGKMAFANSAADNATSQPGLEALRFYTDFALPTKQVHSWDSQMPDALEAFIAGKTAFFFGYEYQRDIIKNQASKLNWSVGPMPQVDPARPVYYANYWVQSVAKRSTHANEAWDFIQYLSRPDVVVKYLVTSGKTAALTSLVNVDIQDADPLISTFAQEAVNAKSWYHGRDPGAAETAFANMVRAVTTGTQTLPDAITFASKEIEQSY